MCVNCSKKENLKLSVPENIDLKLFDKYVTEKNSGLNATQVFNWFKIFYGGDWVYNPKQVRRAYINMEILYYTYKDHKVILKK